MTKYFLHTGLHKTGTKFFQHKVFPNLPEDEFEYNPLVLTQYISDLMKADPEDLDIVYSAIEAEKRRIEESGVKNVLISREIMSGDLFSFYIGYEDRYSRIHKAFPEAIIIFFLRYQVDWILSCYRETVHEHNYQSFDNFLSNHEGKDSFVKANYKDLDWSGILKTIINLYGSENIDFYFYEDFKKNKGAVVQSIADTLGVKVLKITDDGDSIPNRGYSAFSILLSIFRYKLLKTLYLNEYLIHRPIKFFGKGSIPAGFEEISVLPKDKYWHAGFKRDNEEVRSENYPDNLTSLEKLKLKLSWRSLIKNGLDKLIYWDWDLIASKRKELDIYFKDKNINLEKEYEAVIGKLPKDYTK